MGSPDSDAGKPQQFSSKKERSPSFPYIGLPKAIDRLRAVYASAKRHEARVADVAEAWGMGPKSSATLQTIAALLAFGLLEDQGSGETRKVRLTDLGFKAIADERPGAKEAALAAAASKPKLMAEYIEKWRVGRPADGICVSELRIDRGFTDDGARAFLRVFDETVGFTVRSGDDKIDDKIEAPEPALKVAVGDYIQWTSQGADRFKEPRQVREISDDGCFLFVFNELGGIPVDQVTVVLPPEKKAADPSKKAAEPSADKGVERLANADISVLMRGDKLEIAATVDLDGLAKLKEMLGLYEQILKLSSGSH